MSREENLTGKSPSEESAHANIILCLNFAKLFVMKSGKLYETSANRRWKNIHLTVLWCFPFMEHFRRWRKADFKCFRWFPSSSEPASVGSSQIKVMKPRFEKFNLPRDVLMPRCLINSRLRRSEKVETWRVAWWKIHLFSVSTLNFSTNTADWDFNWENICFLGKVSSTAAETLTSWNCNPFSSPLFPNTPS